MKDMTEPDKVHDVVLRMVITLYTNYTRFSKQTPPYAAQ